MDIAMFFEFPGILITIGVIMLLISIIIIIVAYRSDIKDVDASKLSTSHINFKDETTDEFEETTEEINDKKDLEKTKIFKPLEIVLEEQEMPKENNKSKPMGIKDMLEDINKVDDKKDVEKDETVNAFDEEFDSANKEKQDEVKIDKNPIEEIKTSPEEDEEIELL